MSTIEKTKFYLKPTINIAQFSVKYIVFNRSKR